MKLAVRIGWDSLFIMNEKQLAALMPVLETCHYVKDQWVDNGGGLVYVYSDFKPEVKVLGKNENVFTEEELVKYKEELERKAALAKEESNGS